MQHEPAKRAERPDSGKFLTATGSPSLLTMDNDMLPIFTRTRRVIWPCAEGDKKETVVFMGGRIQRLA